MRASILLLVIATLSPGVAIATRRVPAEYPTIQAGIDAALSSLDTVLVAPGTYLENLVTRGIPITLVSEAGPAATIIDGSNPDDPDSASVILALSALNIEGFTITGGSGTLSVPDCLAGGGLALRGAATIRGNWITENHVISPRGYGGGIEISQVPDYLNLRIIGNRIYSNSARDGGAIFNAAWSDWRQLFLPLGDNYFSRPASAIVTSPGGSAEPGFAPGGRPLCDKLGYP